MTQVEGEEESEEGGDEQVPNVSDSGRPESSAHVFVHDNQMRLYTIEGTYKWRLYIHSVSKK